MIDFPLIAFLQYGLALVIFEIKPGPSLLTLFDITIKRGLARGVLFALGQGLALLIYVTLTIAGYAIAQDFILLIEIIFKILGGLLLIYMGLVGYSDQMDALIDQKPSSKLEKKSKTEIFMQGFLVTGTNPIVFIFFAAFLSTFIDLETIMTGTYIFGLTGIILFSIGTKLAVALLFYTLGKKILKDTILIWVNKISSLLIVLIGVVVFLSAIPFVPIKEIYFS